MIDDRQVISYKTDAWKDAAFVAHYDARMGDASSGIQVKNAVETELIARFARGTRILDVGIGTGRASLPLARAGAMVTGVDSSQAMLDVTKRNAGDLPIRLVPGDVARLPFDGERFESVIALNTLAHFPHWRAILAEWQRCCEPGGRLVFDLFSLDHHHAVGRARGLSPDDAARTFGPTAVHDYYTRVTADELVDACDALGLHVVDLAPYGALFGLASTNDWLRDSAAFDRSWDRLCSWTNRFPQLLEMFVALERRLLSPLGTAASGRMMVALVNAPDAAANARWKLRNVEKNEALRGGLSPAAAAAGGIDVDALRGELDRALRFRPNRIALFRLLTAAMDRRWPVPLDQWLQRERAEELIALIEREQLDRDVAAAVTAIARSAGTSLHLDGIDLGDAFKYEVTEAILDRGLEFFGP